MLFILKRILVFDQVILVLFRSVRQRRRRRRSNIKAQHYLTFLFRISITVTLEPLCAFKLLAFQHYCIYIYGRSKKSRNKPKKKLEKEQEIRKEQQRLK